MNNEHSTRDKYAAIKLERFIKFQSNTISVQCVFTKTLLHHKITHRIVFGILMHHFPITTNNISEC